MFDSDEFPNKTVNRPFDTDTLTAADGWGSLPEVLVPSLLQAGV
jgi:hypothetical protein